MTGDHELDQHALLALVHDTLDRLGVPKHEYINLRLAELQERARLTGDCLVRLEQENERQENLLRRCRDTMNSFGWRHDKTETAELLDAIDRELKGDA